MERTESARLCTYDCERCIIDMRRYFCPQQPNPFDIFGTQVDELQDKLFEGQPTILSMPEREDLDLNNTYTIK